MSDLPEAWRDYARIQTSVSSRRCINPQAWGLEAGLNYLLDIDPSNNIPQQGDLDRVIARGRARENYRARLRAWYMPGDEVDDPRPMLDQRTQLHGLLTSVAESDREILVATGLGDEAPDIAERLKRKPATIRKRLERLRDRLAAYRD